MRVIWDSDCRMQTSVEASAVVRKYLEGKQPKKVIVVQKKLVNIVV